MMKLLSIHKPSSRTSERKRARSGIHVGAWRQAARSFARSLPFFNVMSGLDTGIQGDRSVACPWTLGSSPRVTVCGLLLAASVATAAPAPGLAQDRQVGLGKGGGDRKSVGSGKGGSVRGELGGRRVLK